jgi:F-type H+-transporting ATPase subunit gamma
LPIGKKGGEFFAKTNANMDYTFRDTFLNLSGDAGFKIGEFLLGAYQSKKFDAIELVYNQFKNAATLILANEPFLPIDVNNFGGKAKDGKKNDYIFEPSNVEILEALIPRILKTQLYRALLDSFASEHGARMVAMDKATENAGDLLKSLKVEYNRARQAAITTEISEIVSGAAAQSAG